MKLLSGKLNLNFGGQIGSEGKGLGASYVAAIEHIDIAVTDAAPNAGHTFYWKDEKYVVKMLPVAGVIQERNTIYFCPGAIIDPRILLNELDRFSIDPDRVVIHPRCAVITQEDIDYEKNPESSVTKIASTQSGVGSALSRKILRSAQLAGDHPLLKRFINHHFNLQQHLDWGCTAFMEMPQGLDLSLSSGLAYPFCTSREITVSGALSDAQCHPFYLGKVIVVIRTFPIRVGNIVHEGKEIGNSGPFYSDSRETTWTDLGLDIEFTTVTGRIRRVATFSLLQYQNMLSILRPDYILLNFCNYMEKYKLDELLVKLPEVTHLGFGPEIIDVKLNHYIM